MPPRLLADIYGEQMHKAGHGYGLYEPELEVHPGDVGYLFDGGVQVLFNILRDEDDERQRLGVPEGFQKLVLADHLWRRRDEWYDQPVLISSETAVRRTVGLDANAQIVATDALFRVDYTSTCGAALVTRSPASRIDILPQSTTLRNYIRTYIDSWYDFAAAKGYTLKEGSIFLVRGCDKTIAWSLAVFSGISRGLSLEFRGGYPGIASAGVLLSGDWTQLPNVNQRSGPTSRSRARNALPIAPPPDEAPAVPPIHNHDQTVLLRVWKIKRRILGVPIPPQMKAAAEPQDPEDDDDSSSDEASSLSAGYVNHPLDALLDYVLKESPNCKVAIVDDDDYYRLSQLEQDSQMDMAHILQKFSPQVEIDDDGAGYLADNDTARALEEGSAMDVDLPHVSYLSLADPSAKAPLSEVKEYEEAKPLHKDGAYGRIIDIRPSGHLSHNEVPEDANRELGILDKRRTLTDFRFFNDAIEGCRQELALRPAGHPLRHESLWKLADSLYTLYEKNRSVALIEEAVPLARESVSLCPPTHYFYPQYLGSLAVSLEAYGKALGDERSALEAEKLFEQVNTLEEGIYDE